MARSKSVSPPLIAAAFLITVACLLIWCLPPVTQDHGFFGHYTIRQLLVGLFAAVASVGFWCAALARPERRRAAFFRAGVVLVTTVVGWTAVETVHFLVRPDPINPFYEVDPRWNLPDEELGFVRRPNVRWAGKSYDDPNAHHVVYRTDQNGFRNPPGIERADLVFIGDSFTEAGNVPEQDTFVFRVGEKLGTVAVNLGRAYYGPQQELVVLKRYGLGYEPKTIVWVICEGNDLTDAGRYLRGVLNRPASRDTPLPRWSSRSLLSYRLLLPFLTTAPPSGPENTEKWVLRDASGRRHEVDFAVAYVPDLVQRLPQAWEATRQSILEGQALSRRHDVELLIVFVPIKFRVYAPFCTLSTPQQEYPVADRSQLTDPEDFGNQLARFCRQIECRFLDTYPALVRAAGRGEWVYSLRYDTHLDVAGHRVVADCIAEVLRDRADEHRPAEPTVREPQTDG